MWLLPHRSEESVFFFKERKETLSQLSLRVQLSCVADRKAVDTGLLDGVRVEGEGCHLLQLESCWLPGSGH